MLKALINAPSATLKSDGKEVEHKQAEMRGSVFFGGNSGNVGGKNYICK